MGGFSIQSRRMFPHSGATGVPTNARVVVMYLQGGGNVATDAGGPVMPSEVALRVRGGELVAVTRELLRSQREWWMEEAAVVLTPSAALQPNTVYEVLDDRPMIPCVSGNPALPCTIGPPAPIATFTTGAEADLAAPRFEGLASLTRAEIEDGRSESCGAYISRSFTLAWAASSDDVAPGQILYNVYRRDPSAPAGSAPEKVLAYLPSLSVTMSRGCVPRTFSRPPLISPTAIPGEEGIYSVRAVDWAGNEAPNSKTQVFVAECPPPPAESGPDADAGADGPLSRDVGSELDAGTDAAGADLQPVGMPDAAVADGAASSSETACAPANADAGGCAFVGDATARSMGGIFVVVAAVGIAVLSRRRRAPRDDKGVGDR